MAKKSESKEKNDDKPRSDGKFVKGHKKVGGRQAGTPNKYGNVRDRLKEKVIPFLDKIDVIIAKIDDPKEQADTISKFLPYFLPRYSNTTLSADADRPISEEQRLLDVDKELTKNDTKINISKLVIVNNTYTGEDPGDDDSGIDLSELGL